MCWMLQCGHRTGPVVPRLDPSQSVAENYFRSSSGPHADPSLPTSPRHRISSVPVSGLRDSWKERGHPALSRGERVLSPFSRHSTHPAQLKPFHIETYRKFSLSLFTTPVTGVCLTTVATNRTASAVAP